MKPISLPELPTESRRQIVAAKAFSPALCRPRFAPAERPIPVFQQRGRTTGAPNCMDIPRPASPGTKWAAEDFAERFSVYVPDLRRDYGRFEPPGRRRLATSITRSAQWRWTRSRRCVILATSSFLVGAHDSRWARVAHRLCLDFPKKLSKRFVSWDIAPTFDDVRTKPTKSFATKYMWWFFLTQAAPLPEHLIGLDPQYYLGEILSGLNQDAGRPSRPKQ